MNPGTQPLPQPEPEPDRQQPDGKVRADQAADFAGLVIPSEIAMGKQKTFDDAADREFKTTASTRRLSQNDGKEQDIILTSEETTLLAVAARMVRSQYDQSEAPLVIPSLVRKCVTGKLPEDKRVEVRKLGLRWANWANAILAETERQIAIRATAGSN